MDDSGRMWILIVEDDPDACDNLQDILELTGHRIAAAHTAAEALEYVASAPVSVILLDWELPDATALELLPVLNRRAPDSDVIIVTGCDDFDLAVVALREGAADYLLKPINARALQVSLQRIADRRRLARDKRQSESMFRRLVETAPCAIAIVRSNGSIVYFSPFAAELTGYDAAEVLGQGFDAVLQPDDDVDGAACELPQILAGETLRGWETTIRCRDGSRRSVVWNAQALDGFEGAPAVLFIGQDITEHKRTVEQLVQSERLAAIGEAMTGLIHESRNALQRSQAALDMLGRRVDDRPEDVKLLTRLQTAQDDLHRLYEEVRQYAAPIRLHTELCDPADVFDEAWGLMEHERKGRDIRLSRRREPGGSVCLLDRFALRRVFRNILENALAACPDPVEIEFSIRHKAAECGSLVEVSVRDNGPGLTDEQRARIFEPFYTTKTHGTGLGMTLCRRIVEAHGGTIGVGSGPGADIMITLPCEENADATPRQAFT